MPQKHSRRTPDRLIEWTGERCVPWVGDLQVAYEHYHRYLVARALVDGASVLDLASGEGYGAAMLAQRAARVVGLEIDPATVAHSRRNYSAENLEFVEGSMLDLRRFDDDSFDVVTCFEALEHVAEHEVLVDGVCRVLRDGGIFVTSTPDRLFYTEELGQHNPYHVRELTLAELRTLVDARFAYARYFGQALAIGSLIQPADADESGDGEVLAIARKGEEWVERASYRPTYYIAVASRRPLPEIPTQSVLVDVDLELVRSAQRAQFAAEEQLRTEQARLHDPSELQLSDSSEKNSLIAEKSTLIEEIARHEVQLTRAERDLAFARGALDHADRESRRLEEQATRLEQELASTRGALDDAELVRASAEDALRELSASRATRAVLAYRRWVAGLLPAGSRRRAVWQHLTRSTSPVVASAVELDPALPTHAAELTIRTSKDPVVSIIIPVHGAWEYTLGCLRSLAADAIDTPVEVLVVDDASPDKTRSNLASVHGVRTISLDTNVGFLAACNLGIAEAVGRFVLFLNNDTEVATGCIDALVRAASDETAGAVGSRLVYPDGSLQEAGAVIFSDGRGWNFGRGANADDPRYNFRRSVDYCSGAALLVRKDLLDEIGGFDTRFAPAYYEDTDLCFAIRALGFDVVYQPTATVVHFEGVSHGTDERTGVKAHQEINRLKFIEKWGDVLETQPRNDPTAVPLSAWKGRLGVVIIIDHYVPRPDQDSGSTRQVGIMRALLDMGYGVLFVPDNADRAEPYTSMLQEAGIEVLYGHADLATHLDEIAPLIRLAIVARPDVGWRFIPLLREMLPGCPIVYDTLDLHYLRERRQAALTGESSLARRSETTRQRELALMRLSDLTLVVSPTEVDVLAHEAPDVPVRVLSNVHRAQVLSAAPDGRRDLLFVGSFVHPPNVDAVLWFAKDVLPLITARRPGVRLRVVGGGAPDELRALASASVDILGWVPDLAPIYAEARVAVAPLRYGAGVKGKIGESLSYGVPVVTTQIGAEGMGLVDDLTARVTDTAAEFAEAVVGLLADDEQWSRISSAGIAHVEERFGADATRRALAGLLAATLDASQV